MPDEEEPHTNGVLVWDAMQWGAIYSTHGIAEFGDELNVAIESHGEMYGFSRHQTTQPDRVMPNIPVVSATDLTPDDLANVLYHLAAMRELEEMQGISIANDSRMETTQMQPFNNNINDPLRSLFIGIMAAGGVDVSCPRFWSYFSQHASGFMHLLQWIYNTPDLFLNSDQGMVVRWDALGLEGAWHNFIMFTEGRSVLVDGLSFPSSADRFPGWLLVFDSGHVVHLAPINPMARWGTLPHTYNVWNQLATRRDIPGCYYTFIRWESVPAHLPSTFVLTLFYTFVVPTSQVQMRRYNVDFYVEGYGIVDRLRQTLRYNAGVSTPGIFSFASPWRDGYRLHWYTTPTGNERFAFWTTPVTGNMTIYGRWVAIYHTVNFNVAGYGVIPALRQDVRDNGRATAPTNAPTRAGYTLHWYTVASGGTRFNFDTTPITGQRTLFGRWVVISERAPTITYTYRADGLRHSKTVDGVKTTHLWDGAHIVAEQNAAGAVINRFDRGAGWRVIRSEHHGWYLHNVRGDVVQRTNAIGTVMQMYMYSAFGVELGYNANNTNPWRFAGEYWDVHTQTYYLRARHFNPRTGRFTQPDPHWNIGNMMDNNAAILQAGNLFMYVMHNPVRFVDPSGLMAEDRLIPLKEWVEMIGRWSWIHSYSLEWDEQASSALVTIRSDQGSATQLFSAGANGAIMSSGTLFVRHSSFNYTFGSIIQQPGLIHTPIRDSFMVAAMAVPVVGAVRGAWLMSKRVPAAVTGVRTPRLDNLDSLLSDPGQLNNATPAQWFNFFKGAGHNPQPLGQGSLRGVPFNQGGGFRVYWGGDRTLQFHPGGGHHGISYWKITSGTGGKIRIDMSGNILP